MVRWLGCRQRRAASSGTGAGKPLVTPFPRARSGSRCAHRDFTAPAPNLKWCGDVTEIPTGEGKLYPATVIDLYSRRLLA